MTPTLLTRIFGSAPAASGALLAVAILGQGPLAAQPAPLRVTVLEVGTGTPIPTAMVELLDAEGRRVWGGFAGAGGGVTARLPPGVDSVEVRADRIGYGRVSSGLIARDEALAGVELRLETLAIELPGIEASGTRRCEGEAADGERIWRIWTDARTGLRAALLTEEEELVRFSAASWVRDLARDGEVLLERESTAFVTTRQPFHTLPPQQLASEGYIQVDEEQVTHFYGPDARVLLSDTFLDTHCFTLGEGEPGSIHLHFAPMPGRSVADIRGVLRLDATSYELREVEYEYVSRLAQRSDLGGGLIEFRALKEGPWVVERWSIRMPLGTSRLRAWLFGTPVYREAGGEVREVEDVRRVEEVR